MSPLDDAGLALLFTEARTIRRFLPRPVAPDLLRKLYALACLPPTSDNGQPARYVFITTPEARQRLLPALSPGNVDKVLSAPVTVILAYDNAFYEWLPELGQKPEARDKYATQPELAAKAAFRNGTLGAAYLMLAARACGLDCGPMGGFKAGMVNDAFFPDGRWQANFLLNLGYADPAHPPRPRAPRLGFEQACQVL